MKDLPAILNAADIAVSIPSSDGTAMSVLEAMACGVPLIVSDLPSNHEWITPGVNGEVVPVGDQKELTEKMINLLRDTDMRERYSEMNVQTISDRADHDKHMAQMEVYYRDLCENRSQELT